MKTHLPSLHFPVLPRPVLMLLLLFLLPWWPILKHAEKLSVSAQSKARSALYSVHPDGTGITLLRADPKYALWGPAWSPDGKTIAVTFADMDHATGEIYLLDQNGQNPRQLTHNGRNNYYAQWSHDGKRIAFITQQGRDVNTSEIETSNVDGTDERQLTYNQAWDYGATWSPDDRQIAFGTKQDGTWQIDLMDADGKNQHPLPVRASGNAPVWSPDGRWIAFKSDREGNDNIYISEPDGSQQQNLTRYKAINSNPAWSPDGKQIAFWSDRNGPPNIFVMDRDGTHLVDITQNTGLDAELPAWSPDGTRILFHGITVQSGIVAWAQQHVGWLAGGIIALIGIIASIIGWRRHSKAGLR